MSLGPERVKRGQEGAATAFLSFMAMQQATWPE